MLNPYFEFLNLAQGHRESNNFLLGIFASEKPVGPRVKDGNSKLTPLLKNRSSVLEEEYNFGG